ncbi:hypothetical protein, partial [Alcaligenes phenolicus]|uniref:hypothetical protein n=1 Tax=Alcaligenes phenolicus TaxID=232846 RepID=UPI002AA748C6
QQAAGSRQQAAGSRQQAASRKQQIRTREVKGPGSDLVRLKTNSQPFIAAGCLCTGTTKKA